MVKSVDRLTKLLCIIGLNNLIDNTTIEFMLSQEIIGSIANISKIGDSNIANLSVRIFNRLSMYAKARLKITEKIGALSSLIAMTDNDVLDTKIIATRTCCNIILDPVVREKAITNGILVSLERCFSIESLSANQTPSSTPTHKSRGMQNTPTTPQTFQRTFQQATSPMTGYSIVQEGLVVQCLISIFSICDTASYMEYCAKSRIPVILLRLITEPGASVDEYTIAAKSLAMMTWNPSSRKYLQQKEIFILLLKLIEVNFKVLAAEWLSAIIRFLVVGYDSNLELIEKRKILFCISKINERNVGKDAAAVSICRSLAATLRTLCEDKSINTADLVTDGTISVLLNASQIGAGDENIMYDVACVLYAFVVNSPEARYKASTLETVRIIDNLQNEPKCAELVAVIIASLAGCAKSRNTFAVPEIIAAIVNLVDLKLNMEQMNSNFILALNFFAKYPAGRVLLLTPSLAIDRTLTALNNHTNLKIKANIARTFKSINTDPNEAIEEGTVASLIAMSLEGKIKNPANDDLWYPQLEALGLSKVPAPCAHHELGQGVKTEEFSWFEQVSVTKGGAAGKGPDPPEPPTSVVDGSKEYPNMAEEVDGVELEGKTKMSLAKMPIPEMFRTSFQLKDEDFMPKESDGNVPFDETNSPSPRFIDTTMFQSLANAVSTDSQDSQVPSPTPSHDSNRSSREGSASGARSSQRIKKSMFLDDAMLQGCSSLGHSNVSSKANTPTHSKSSKKKKSKAHPKELKDDISLSRQAQKLGLYN